MMQYVPEQGVYVYFRYDNLQTVMVIMNTAKEQKNIIMSKFSERKNSFTKMKNIITGEVTDLKDISVEAKGSGVYELMK